MLLKYGQEINSITLPNVQQHTNSYNRFKEGMMVEWRVMRNGHSYIGYGGK